MPETRQPVASFAEIHALLPDLPGPDRDAVAAAAAREGVESARRQQATPQAKSTRAARSTRAAKASPSRSARPAAKSAKR